MTEDLSSFMEGLTNLPSPPTLLTRIDSLLEEPTPDLQQLSELMQLDAALSSKLLHLCNSPFFGLNRQVTTVRQATVLLGANMLRNVVMSASVFGSIEAERELSAKDMDCFWAHSMATAIIARELSAHRGDATPEAFFLGGLLHDVGQLVIASFIGGARYRAIARADQGLSLDLCAHERRALGMSHAEVGEQLGLKWGFPELFVEVIVGHHDVPEEQSSGMGAVARRRIAQADELARRLGHPSPLEHAAVGEGLVGLEPDLLPVVERLMENLDEELGRLVEPFRQASF